MESNYLGITEFTSFISPDGREFVFDSPKKALLTENGFGMPNILLITQKGPFQHGETVIDYRLAPRNIQLLFRQNGDNRDDYWSLRSELLDFLRPNRSSPSTNSTGKLRKRFLNGTVRDIDVLSVGGPEFVARSLDRWDEWGFTETLRFIAHDPTFYDPEEVIIDFDLTAQSQNNLIFPITFPIEFGSLISDETIAAPYVGTWTTFPRITITGPGKNINLENLSTGENIRILYELSSGETITIDCSYGNKTVENGSGDNLIGTLSIDSDLTTFHIASEPEVTGGINNIRLFISEIDSNSSAQLRFFTRFIGI